MTTLKIEMQGLKEVVKLLEKAPRGIKVGLSDTIKKTALFGARRAAEVTPKDTGHARRGWGRPRILGLQAVISNVVGYVPYIRYARKKTSSVVDSKYVRRSWVASRIFRSAIDGVCDEGTSFGEKLVLGFLRKIGIR